MAETVDTAINKTEELKSSPVPTKNAQITIDNQLLEEMKKLSSKVTDIENKLKNQPVNSDSTMWYNNKYAVLPF